MDLDPLLLEAEPQVLNEAYAALQRSHLAHYEAARVGRHGRRSVCPYD